jgi:hypothetical protein
VNFRRLRLGIGLAIGLSIATAAVGLAQTAPLPPPPAPSGAGTAAPVFTTPSATAAPSVVPTFFATAAPTIAPVATSSPAGPRRGRRAPGPAASGPSPSPAPSDTPEPPQFSTLDGIWEIELQPLGKRLATYSHLSIAITGAAINGYWEHDPHKTRSPMTGTFDGRLISMTVKLADGTTPSFSGYVENFADMVGIFKSSDKDVNGTAFTAQHRKKLK